MRSTIIYNLMARGLRRFIGISLVGTIIKKIIRSSNISIYTLAIRGLRINGVLKIEY